MRNLVNRRSLVLAGLGAPMIARAVTRVMRLGYVATQFPAASAAFAEAVATHPALGASVAVEVHDEASLLKQCRDGAIDLMAGATAQASKWCPEVGILTMPFVFKDATHARAAFDGAMGDEYAALLSGRDIHVMAWLESGVRHLTANRPVRHPNDLAGLRLRVPPSRAGMESFRFLGADARPLVAERLYAALRSGQFDAQEDRIAPVEAMRLQEVQRCLCLTGHTYSSGFIAASPDMMAVLTPVQIVALRACGKAATSVSRHVADRAQRDGIARLRGMGMAVIDDVDRDAFIKAARPNLDQISPHFDAARVARLVSAAA